ncbi:MAG: serine/threonine-protein kinase, partial [Geminicoccaceae bacterium]
MGVTYLAVDVNLDKQVALKVIRSAKVDIKNIDRMFRREARLAARLQHRNVASVFHLGEKEGAYYYAMEYVPGKTVSELIRSRGVLPPLKAMRICAQVARALVAAQKHRLVHRDIKPSNIMVAAEEDGEMVVKLIDFGLAKPLLASDDDRSQFVTATGVDFMGTPAYASPEQCKSEHLDTRSDIYALGCTLWTMLVGSPPFSGQGLETLISQIRDDPPWDKLTGIPRVVVNLLHEMLRKEPAKRPPTAEAVLEKCQA